MCIRDSCNSYKSGFTGAILQLVGCGDLDAPMPRQRHETFGKAHFADRRGELCSPINCKVEASDSTNFCNQTFNSRAGMHPHFKRFFRGMAQKDLFLSDVCLPFCGHSLLFFCRRFLFQIKRKCRNAESVYHLIIVGREGRSQLSTSRNCYNFISAIADSGQPQGLSLRRVLL